MQFKDVVMGRKSIRAYKKDKVSKETLYEVLTLASRAVSGENMQPWEFYVITNNSIMNEIRSFVPYFNYNSSLMIVVCGNTSRSITKNDNDFWIQDCSSAVENILLTATSLNLGTVWCGLYPVIERSNKIKQLLKCPNDIIPMALIHVGYPDEEKEERTQYNENYVHYIK